MTKYPKLPYGPGPVGAAGVRAIQATGGPYQRKRVNANETAVLSGPFQKVIVEGVPEYVTTFGLSADAGYGALRYKMPYRALPGSAFTRFTSESRPTYCGGNNYLFSEATVLSVDADTVNYPRSPDIGGAPRPDLEAVIYASNVRLTVSSVGYRRKEAKAKPILDIIGRFITYGRSTPLTYMNYLNSMRLAYLGRYMEEDAVFSVIPVTTGRTDSQGRELQDLEMVVFAVDGSGVLDRQVIAAPGGAEFIYPPTICVTENKVHMLVAESDVYRGTSGPGYSLRVWAVVVESSNITSYTVTDVGAIVDEANYTLLPSDYSASQTGPHGLAERRAAYARTVALPGDQSLHFWEDSGTTDDATPIYYGPDLVRRQSVKCIRVSGTSTALTLDLKTDLPQMNLIEYGPITYKAIHSVVHLGNGVVLATLTNIIPRLGTRMSFIRSTDFGSSWSQVVPTGFDQSLEDCQYFGSMTLHKAGDDDSVGTVFMPSWDGAAYFVYESKDVGSTWKKAGIIKTSDFFYNIITWDRTEKSLTVATSGSHPEVTRGFFEFIMPGPSTTTPVDKALPDRYKG